MININGEEWRIALVSPLDPVLRRSDKSYTIGVCDDILKTIFIIELFVFKQFNIKIVKAIVF